MYTLNYTIDIATANRLFLFNCDDTLTDLDNAIPTDLKFATNNLQYDIKNLLYCTNNLLYYTN